MAHTTLEMAARYRELGLSCIPLAPRSKRPAISSWTPYRERLPEAGEIREWFSSEPRNVGIVCGAVSGNLVVRDFDVAASYETWSRQHPELAMSLPTVQTARGYHVYFRAPALPPTRQFSDGELRGEGAYVVAPQSTHESGVVYTWIVDPGGIPLLDISSSGLDAPNATQEHREPRSTGASVPVLQSNTPVGLAIRRCIPPAPGHRHTCLFRLARELKALPEISCLSIRSLLPILQEWHRLALPFIGTKDFATSWAEFAQCWADVRYAINVNPLNQCLEKSKMNAIPPELAEVGMTDPKRVALANLCRELQRANGDKPFFLDARTAAKLADIGDHTVAWRWLREFCAIGLMQLVSSGSQVKKRANEYRYLGELGSE